MSYGKNYRMNIYLIYLQKHDDIERSTEERGAQNYKVLYHRMLRLLIDYSFSGPSLFVTSLRP